MSHARLPARAAVVALVAVLGAACGSPETAPVADPAEADVVLVGDDRLQFSESEVSAPAGEVRIALTCDGRTAHDIVVMTPSEEVRVAACAGGETTAGAIELDAGEYDFFCSLPGHRRNMQGVLTIT